MTSSFFNVIPGDGSAALLLYGDIGDGYKVESGRIVSELLALQSQYKKIDVRINSRGGDVFSGMAIYNALRQSKSDITIYIDGVAASIAAIIALCGKPLYMSPYAKLMLHSVSGGTWGNASVLRQTADQMEQLQKDLSNMIAGRCGMKAKEVQAKYFDEKDHWIDAKEAVDMKLCDGIYDMETTEKQPTTTDEIYNYFNNRLVSGPQNQNEMALIDDIKAIPSFSDKEDASAIVAHIKALENTATKVNALQQTNDAYKAQIENLQKKEVEVFLNKAVSEGKITKEQLPLMEKLMNSDRKAAEELINSMKPASPARRAVDFINHEDGKGGFENKTWDQLDKENLLAELKDKDFSLFCSKFKDKFGIDYKE
ncbi:MULTISPECIES: head maturation protease, ClpP-related [Prevotellaceae]|uniref:head maturation protease, ClpP-related n=1 Tax=Prevotellaceae TaxID=171552 RepID=UPI000D0C44EA|nr:MULTISPECIES: head maturation protease, ClpP-related [Prevotellaceae]GAY28503.1 aTP-dependent Clp protease proteolytic subunit [Prevotella sp. MGM1]